MILQDWLTTAVNSWVNILDRLVVFLPSLIGALVIIIVGWIIGMIVAVILDRFFRLIGLQTLFEKAKVEDILKKGNIDQDATSLLASAAKWIVYLVALVAAANILSLPDVANFLDRILAYIPSAIAAMVIILIGLTLANFFGTLIKGFLKASDLHAANMISSVVRYAIVIFTFLAALSQLGIASNLIQTFFIGLVAFFAIAGGLAFGLGGKDAAADWIAKIQKEIKD